MIVAVLMVFGLCLGSFVNALVWRIHQQAAQATKKKVNKKYSARLSLMKGRSMCPHCHRELATKDLLPVLSWVGLRGVCRYCRQPISLQYPLVELATALLFVACYLLWPVPIEGLQAAIFGLWLLLLVGFMALIVYDLRWYLLPDRIILPLSAIALTQAALVVLAAPEHLKAALDVALAVAVTGGIFFIIYQVSKGKWIGGGDVKLGWLLGLTAATPGRGMLIIFTASLLGSLVTVPLLLSRRIQRNAVIPFGPFLIVAAIIVQLFGSVLLLWYKNTFLTPI